jgi:predicted O-linked N-acetylglucosamine transferase (SPINDLY family)
VADLVFRLGRMSMSTETLGLALEHHRAGRLAEAESLYRDLLAAVPEHVDALQLLGLILHQTGRTDQAIDHLRAALRLKPDYAEVHNNLGNMLSELRQFDEAIACFREAIRVNPAYAEAHVNLGNALQSSGKPEEARASYGRGLQLQPSYADAAYNLGLLAMGQGRSQEAVDWYRHALALTPHHVRALNNLGLAFLGQGRAGEAIACHEQVLRLDSANADARNNLGIALRTAGRWNDAIACYRELLRVHPNHIDAHYNLGNALMHAGEWAGAQASFENALRLRPDHADAHNNLGLVFKEQHRFDEAFARFEQALQLRPNHADACTNLGNVLKDRGQIVEARAWHERATECDPANAAFHSNLVFSLGYNPTCDAADILRAHQRWYERHALPFAASIRPHDNDRRPDRRLRIGYVSPDFRDHVVGRNIWPIFREHDREGFEIFVYANVVRPDALTRQFESRTDHWRWIANADDDAVAAQVRADRIDILVDLALHTAGNRLLVFARKPAPVQVTFAGYPGTTGLKTIDYRLTDSYLDPPGQHDERYTETSIRLPDSFWCFDPLGVEPPLNELPALSRGVVTFGCLNSFCKINPGVLERWAKVLRAVNGSRLVMLANSGSHRQRTPDLLAAEGVASERVSFVGGQLRPKYLELYHDIDVVLDTLPYNGHSTSLDALWMGVPVVTQIGDTVVGRAGWSQLKNLGLAELAATSTEQFVDIAAALARDLPRLRELRATLRERMRESPLMDGQNWTLAIESAYRRMWHLWCDGST